MLDLDYKMHSYSLLRFFFKLLKILLLDSVSLKALSLVQGKHTIETINNKAEMYFVCQNNTSFSI